MFCLCMPYVKRLLLLLLLNVISLLGLESNGQSYRAPQRGQQINVRGHEVIKHLSSIGIFWAFYLFYYFVYLESIFGLF